MNSPSELDRVALTSAKPAPNVFDGLLEISPTSGVLRNQPAATRAKYGALLDGLHATERIAVATALPLIVGWRYRELTRALLRRDLADRFRGAAFGWAWAIIGPVITLAIYTRAFTHVMQLPAASAQGSWKNYALSTFVGLIIFGLCAELIYRAPGLLHERAAYIKYSIFPSEMLAWTAVFRALAYAGDQRHSFARIRARRKWYNSGDCIVVAVDFAAVGLVFTRGRLVSCRAWRVQSRYRLSDDHHSAGPHDRNPGVLSRFGSS